MSATPRFALFDGRLIPFGDAVVPIEDRGLQFGESIYEVIPLTRGKPRLLEAHHRRMMRGAEALALDSGMPSLAELEAAISLLAREENVAEGLLYLQITGGSSLRRHLPTEPRKPTFFGYLRAHRFPRAADFEQGLAVVTLADERWARCDLKTTQLVASVRALETARAQQADEALFLGPGGELREGSSWNVLLVRDGRVRTPRLGTEILPGLTRELVLGIAAELTAGVTEADLDRAELEAADEVLLVSTSRGCLPVTRVDDRVVGAGRPGPVGRAIAGRLRRALELDD